MDLTLIFIIITILNLASFLVIARDKALSMSNNRERIPEGIIFFMAAAFGSVGIYAAMLAFRHKTRKWYFMLGIPLLILENAASLLLIKQLWF